MDSEEMKWRSACPICSALDVLGDRWTMLIVRDLIVHGPRTYSELLDSPEGIATNILADRLSLLSSLMLVERVNPDSPARNNAFRLTKGGEALRPVLEGLGKWAQVNLKNFHQDMLRMPDSPKKRK
ncbi:MAG: helix-turn-helix domain-containing protein [Verrucomicrobiota bacterium]|jgi:DNA-binding HxlR family transcriptional regulator